MTEISFCNTNNYHTFAEIAIGFLKDLDRLLEVESFLEGDPSVGALHLTDTPTTQKLIVTCVHIGVLGQNVIA